MVVHTVLFWLARQSATANDEDVPLRVYLSNIAGALSILCWFIVFTPQFWTNYKRKSGESLSLVFLYIWLAGDVMNLIGATLDNLLVTMQVLAWYYTASDILMIGQVFYYRRTSVKASFESVITHASPESLNDHTGEHAPLLGGPSSSAANYASVSPSEHVHDNEHDRVIHQAAMVANATATHQRDHPSLLNRSENQHSRCKLITIGGALLSIVLIVVSVWALFGHNGSENGKQPTSPPHDSPFKDGHSFLIKMRGGQSLETNLVNGEEKSPVIAWIALILGWGSAFLYLGSRVPQIYKNWRLKSCEGLSFMMFVFSVFGNVFYVASILLDSLEVNYLIRNFPWILGSGGTLFFDFTIFYQFHIYRHNTPLTEALKEAAETGELSPDALRAAAEENGNASSPDPSVVPAPKIASQGASTVPNTIA